jgi:DNA repair exonuclease SbcCD ATPase subunit
MQATQQRSGVVKKQKFMGVPSETNPGAVRCVPFKPPVGEMMSATSPQEEEEERLGGAVVVSVGSKRRTIYTDEMLIERLARGYAEDEKERQLMKRQAKEIKQLKEEAAKAKVDAARLNVSVIELNQRNGALENKLNEEVEKNTELEEELNEKNAKLKQQAEEIKDLKEEVAMGDRIIVSDDEKISELKGEITNLLLRICDLQCGGNLEEPEPHGEYNKAIVLLRSLTVGQQCSLCSEKIREKHLVGKYNFVTKEILCRGCTKHQQECLKAYD